MLAKSIAGPAGFFAPFQASQCRASASSSRGQGSAWSYGQPIRAGSGSAIPQGKLGGERATRCHVGPMSKGPLSEQHGDKGMLTSATKPLFINGRTTVRKCIMIFKLIVSAGVLLSSALSGQAQTTIDASKITCSQFVHHAVGNPRVLGAWLSGFYNGKRDNSVVSVQDFQESLSKLQQFCSDEKNFKVPVMQAIEKLFRPGK